jgi:hypothetical protein
MERESFENAATARYLNEHFVSIKVDREERPDVDKIYMTAVQAISGSGGWPLNVFLTTDLHPFYGGTYWPPEPRHGRPSFLQVLQSVQAVWTNEPGKVLETARTLTGHLEALANQHSADALLHPRLLTNAAEQFQAEFDAVHGGFGSAPKFPRPAQPAFLLRHAFRTGDEEAKRMVLFTCDKMAAGGMNDQLGGGFARYSVDERWLVPHFEKMLYDNAQLAQLYLDAFLISGEQRHAKVARSILDYVLRDMTHPDGGFYSAEDADSEGYEGKFYCWTRQELSALLTPEEFNVAVKYFGVTAQGNFLDHSHPEPLTGQNVLSVADPELQAGDESLLASARAKMLAARAGRVRPHLDDKVLASWNGMMLGAMARAGIVLGEPRYQTAAERNAGFLKSRLWDAPTRTLYHRWRDGERDNVQLLDAYANLLAGVLDLYEATLQPAHLEWAVALTEGMTDRFEDKEEGGFWQSPAGADDLILRVKEDYDGAEPGGNSVAALALLRLGIITDRSDFREAGERTLRLFADRMQRLPQAVPAMLQALDFQLGEPRRVVITGNPGSPATHELLAAVHTTYHPNIVVLGTTGPVEALARDLGQDPGVAAYVCTGNACLPPARTATELLDLLKRETP